MKTSTICALLFLSTLAFNRVAHAGNEQCLVPPGTEKIELSPDGTYVAMIRKDVSNLNALILIRISDMDSKSYYPRDYRSAKHSVLDFAWVSNESVVMISDANKNAATLHQVSIGDKSVKTLESEGYWSITDAMPQEPAFLVIRKDSQWGTGVVQLQLRSVSDQDFRKTVFQCETDSSNFQCILDSDHELRLVRRNSGENQLPAWYWKNGDQWQKSALNAWTSILAFEFGKKNSAFVSGWFGQELPSVSIYDFATDKVVKTLLEHPDFAIDRFGEGVLNGHPRAMMGVSLRIPIPKDIWLTNNFRILQAKVDESFPGSLNHICSWDKGFENLVFKRTLLDSPAHFVYFNAKDQSSKLLSIDGGDIRKANMGRSSVVQIQSSEGTLLPAFLTVPKVETPKKLPLILLIEPQVLDGISTFEWNPVASYLATQGFVVLRMNTRATPGLLKGKQDAFKSTTSIQSLFDDLDKGVQDLAASGLIDPERVCIAGSGAGAWVAAIAPTRCKTSFRAVAALNGIFDLEAYRQGYLEPESLKDIVNLPFADPGSGLSDMDLQSLSPIKNLQHYPSAIYLSIGKWSPESFRSQIDDYRSQARKNDVVVRTFEDDWWTINMPPPTFVRAWEEAAKTLVDYTKL